MNRITDIKTLSYFENKDFKTRHGVYQCKFKNENKFFVITNNLVYVLTHYFDLSSLDLVTESVKDELLDLLGLKVMDNH